MNFHNDQSAIVRYSLHSVALGNIHLLRRQKDRVGLENVQFYWMEGLGQYCMYPDIVGRSEKVQNYADVIYGWSLMEFYDTA